MSYGNGGFQPEKHYAEYHLTTTPEVIAVDDDGVTYSKVPNMLMPLGLNFSSASGTLTYNNGSPKRFVVNGTSDLEVNKAVDITYALVVNGTPVPAELTTVSFTAAGKKRNISITAIAILSDGDTIEIHVKGDSTLSTVVTVNKLDVTFLEV